MRPESPSSLRDAASCHLASHRMSNQDILFDSQRFDQLESFVRKVCQFVAS